MSNGWTMSAGAGIGVAGGAASEVALGRVVNAAGGSLLGNAGVEHFRLHSERRWKISPGRRLDIDRLARYMEGAVRSGDRRSNRC